MSELPANLNQLRDCVEEVDAEILRLFARRQEIVRQIGAIKAEQGIAVRNAQVEDAVMKRQQNQAEALGLDPDAVAKLTEILVEHSVKEQIRIHARAVKSSTHSLGRVAVIGARGGMGKIFTAQLSGFADEIMSVESEDKSEHGDVSLDDACQSADVLLIAASLRSTPEILDKISASLSRALIVEMSSIKSGVTEWLGQENNRTKEFLSIHPMFGPSARDFVGRIFMFDEARSTERGKNLVEILRQLGAQMVAVPIEEHDDMVSFSLGLPHLVNFIFGKLIEDSGYSAADLLAITGTTFQRQFAVASQVIHQPAELYRDIQILNPNTQHLLKKFSSLLQSFEVAIQTDHAFHEWLGSCRRYFLAK
jgi:prephenate dehydrogenase/chorismate mutase